MDSNKIISYFSEICQIPRESGHEEKIIEFLANFAKTHFLEYKIDDAGNVLISKNATPGRENSPTVVLQSHSDMVCEKNSNSNQDFSKDPIKFVEEDGWLIAKDTTLGADCGIGMAAQMAVLTDDTLEHGKIEALFTSDEETGMTGAKAIKPGFITGKFLINLDSEDEGEIFIGCAGGIDTTAIFNITHEKPAKSSEFIKAGFYGATGGHSGDDINKNRANANQILIRFLLPLFEKKIISICKIDGGNKRNAIAREAFAIIAFNQSYREAILEHFKKIENEVKEEYHVSDPNLFGKVEETEPQERCIDSNTASRILHSLNACPHGVLAMSQDIPDFVETSTNLASVKTSNDSVTVSTSQRSSLNSARYYAASRIESLFKLAGAQVTHESEYPGWKPNVNSKLLEISRQAYKRLFGYEPIVRAIHAGLECGLFLDKYPDLDMVSFGPTLRGVHAPGEKLEIASVEKFWKLLVEILKNLK